MTEEQELAKRAMVIVAHPDDAEFGAGGTVASWTRDGWEVHFLIVTDASGGGADDADDVAADARALISSVRKEEQRQAANVLGVSGVVFLDYPDGLIEPTIELRRDIVRELRTVRPSRIVIPSPDRRWDPFYIGLHHPDHLAVGAAALAAVYPASQNSWDFPDLLVEGLLPHKVREVWIGAAPTLNHWVDVSETIDLKIEALRAHQSQLGAHFDRVEEGVRTRLGEIGAKYGVAAAEEFHLAKNG